ncbi:uncharacterized protein C8A04DRAFT_13882 [Dichotomopilus funicola]|uniref:Midasin n=1 Tax=Dichotomopilus funicola TaxID=1934379 RepID=A0AAN6UZ20_9PEZI|nr:hypothetical protein C8A04DRAFT_13882 [Dichotomopilus funicola]
MGTVDISRQRASLLGDAATMQLLPGELVVLIQDHGSNQLLEAIASAALVAPAATERIFAHFESVFSDICARWVLSHPTFDVKVVSSFARILPFAPSLSVFLISHFQGSVGRSGAGGGTTLEPLDLMAFQDADLAVILLASWRLNNFDKRTFSPLSQPSQLQTLFAHQDVVVRYLAIRIFTQFHEASDQKMEALLAKHIPKDTSLVADFDGRKADYTFLSLYENARGRETRRLRTSLQADDTLTLEDNQPQITPQNLTSLVVKYGKTVLPRPLGPANTPSTLALTSTTVQNLETLSNTLQRPGPILLHGLSGAGKTSLVHEIARELGKQKEMVTLHLNEQTDAKMLLGLYTTDAKPGSFQWRAGVLTTAVREGRWVLIEDLDRAPTEVMSTLLPLIERGELLIPGRGERIQASSGFRLFATVRTQQLGSHDRDSLPNIIGLRLWRLVHVRALPREDLKEVIDGRHPLLHKYTPGILAVFDRLLACTSGPGRRFALGRTALDRPIGMRDLLKWCSRLDSVLRAAGCQTGDEPITDTTRDRMFLEAVDCFVSSLPDAAARGVLIAAVAQEMHLSKERVQHYLTGYVPDMEDSEARLAIGRAAFVKPRRAGAAANKVHKSTKNKRPFATTVHAKRLLEQISVAVQHREPLLLVGETGIGKTTVVQQLADSLRCQLVAVNLSQQSEAGDLLGGFKPVSAQSLAMPLKEEFEDLLERTGVSVEKNREYLERIAKRFAKGRWKEVAKEWRKAPKMFEAILGKLESSSASNQIRDEDRADNDQGGQPAKRRRTESTKLQRLYDLKPRWALFSQSLDQFDRQIASSSAGNGTGSGPGFAFAFVEGKIVKAARNGDWVLLDEINLASPDTLESIAGLFQSSSPSLLLSETGEIERIQAHPNFRVFAAMNPATDVGKRDLPLGLRSRFTELYVGSPDRDKKDLLTIIKTYLHLRGSNNSSIDRLADDVAELYLAIKTRAEGKLLVDQANEVPHFSLRTLTRVLTYANDVAALYGLERALYEGFCMCFTTLLSAESERTVMPLIRQHLLSRPNILTVPPKKPTDGHEYVSFKNTAQDHQYWLLQGRETPRVRDDYIITPYVERNLLNLVRATSTRRYPVLIQGPTSAGKTSMIEYLAHYTGNKFVRINNHEHTDLQEYLGTYVSDAEGKLRFQEGVLVQAMREGAWIVLDELNLAPTDVLEALNRLLDDNRELLIPETQEIVRPAESFCLFATQNPAGLLYGGRKTLSRAFRNRFLELHFDDIPEAELETILQRRSRHTAPSDCRRIVAVYKQLTRLRQESRVFEQKNSFATLRDLFRWALRSSNTNDTDGNANGGTRQELAEHGFMLLAERVRKPEERAAVKAVIEEVFRVTIDPDQLYDWETAPSLRTAKARNSQGVVWTRAMRRLYVLVARAIENCEPVLLVGETGCGKTTVVQLLAEFAGQTLHIVNAHQNTETGDLIGSQRPVRNRGAVVGSLVRGLREARGILGGEKGDEEESVEDLQSWYRTLTPDQLAQLPLALRESIHADSTRSNALFEWSDGSLVHAMKAGTYFLLDEISLADDSVLERLNSVLEPQRTLLLAEKGVTDVADAHVQAAEGFQFFATMNPGGDFGKKELSPALRNRFTEVWVPAFEDVEDVHDIVVAKLDRSFNHKPKQQQGKKGKATTPSRIIVEFAAWFGQTFRPSSATALSVRDILAWVDFLNTTSTALFPAAPELALLHGAAMVYIDTLGANPSALVAVDPGEMAAQRQLCLDRLSVLCGVPELGQAYFAQPCVTVTGDRLTIGDFSLPRIQSTETEPDTDVAPETKAAEPAHEFSVTTTRLNAMRVIRALQSSTKNKKPILLEGNPGVGKTTLVTALARACGRPLTRINLSDQTDLMDLFGTDVPVEGEEAGHFVWRNAPFLEAMKGGGWVLLDEMNLASQSVLEGLNACLDHRGEVYIAELDQVFPRHPDFQLFAAQNPHHQGGGRKGLPSSFVNRFTVVYADVFTRDDLLHITARQFPALGSDTHQQLIEFVARLDDEVVRRRAFGALGAPWEFNLRDVLRWGDLLTGSGLPRKPDDYLDIIIRQRFRATRDRAQVDRLFREVFGRSPDTQALYHDVNPHFAQVGLATLRRNPLANPTTSPISGFNPIPRLREIESVMTAVAHDLPCILVGPSGSGKSALLAHVAALAGRELVVFPLNADVDAMDLIGGFEQADPHRDLQGCLGRLKQELQELVLQALPGEVPGVALDLMAALQREDDDDSSSNQYAHLLPLIEAVQADTNISLPESFSALLAETSTRLRAPLTLDTPRFEWLDGVIVRAVESGAWLVLDHANLCSASVLDRLNSLLERPGGVLSINEHSGSAEGDGGERVIRPHKEFRVFLTVDPRYGELSRAMRNRSVEVYLDVLEEYGQSEKLVSVEGGSERFQTAASMLDRGENGNKDGTGDLTPLAFDILSLSDSNKLAAYLTAAREGLTGAPLLHSASAVQHLNHVLGFVQSSDAAPLREGLATFYSSLTNNTNTPTNHLHLSLHPLLNTPLLRQSQKNQAIWLGTTYELYLSIRHAQSALDAQTTHVNVAKPAGLNRLQRAWAAEHGKVASLAADSTARGWAFLGGVLAVLGAFLLSTTVSGTTTTWQHRRPLLHRLLLFWQRTFTALTAPPSTFDEARFQAHLTQAAALLQSSPACLGNDPNHHRVQDRDLLNGLSDLLQRAFVVGFQLASGRSMEALWRVLRPVPVAKRETLQWVGELEGLAGRFDAVRWRMGGTNEVMDLGALRAVDAVVARGYVLMDGEVGGDMGGDMGGPFFAGCFEGLRRVLVLQEANSHSQASRTGIRDAAETETKRKDTDWTVLSSIPTANLMRLRCLPSTSLSVVDALLVRDSPDTNTNTTNNTNDVNTLIETPPPWHLTPSLLRRLDAAASARLADLRSLEVEMPRIGGALVSVTETLGDGGVLRALGELVVRGIREVVVAAAEGSTDEADAWVERVYGLLVGKVTGGVELRDLLTNLPAHISTPASFPSHLTATINHHFIPALAAAAYAQHHTSTTRDYQKHTRPSLSIAWLHFALGSIDLFVPDKPHDPHHRAQVAADEHRALRASVQAQKAALASFERAFMGQSSTVSVSLRGQILQEEERALGDEPDVQEIYRPEDGGDEGRRLQGEFGNVLRAVGGDVAGVLVRALLPGFSSQSQGKNQTGSESQSEREELELLEQNVRLLMGRLTGPGRFAAHQDVVMPLVGFLRCLVVGLSLGLGTDAKNRDEGEEGEVQQLARVVPFLGGTVFASTFQDETGEPRTLDFLSFVQTVVAVDGLDQLPLSLRQALHASLDIFHEQWTRKLEADRKAAEAETSLFRFKGSAEDQEAYDQEAFDQLFPDYAPDEDGVVKKKPANKKGGRDLAVLLAEAHENIFATPQDPQQSIRALCTQTARRIAASDLNPNTKADVIDPALLPATFFILDEHIRSFHAPIRPDTYNFYTDPHRPQVRAALALVHSLRARFVTLQGIDDIGHHQTLADVVSACDRVLSLAIDDPLARLLPAVEYLYSHVYEWHEGGWASQVHKATALYEALRELICDWRRLELGCWARLLDAEAKRAREEARGWWCIAYGAVVREPCDLVRVGREAEMMQGHAVELLGVLERYFGEATMGGFAARLDLLRQLARQLDCLKESEKALDLLRNAIHGFLALYTRFEPPVAASIKAGRAPLDRSMKDVLLLYKWRDKNIDALRESAKRSHTKLFGLVRKFRGVLDQSVGGIIEGGVPESSHHVALALTLTPETKLTPKIIPAINTHSLTLLTHLPVLTTSPHWPLLSHQPALLLAMARHGALPPSVLNVPFELDTYTTSLVSTVTALRTETPSVLNDETKDTIRHLKTRKVTLYADTLKALRAMGFSRNLGGRLLAGQGSTAAVLVSVGHVPDSFFSGSDSLLSDAETEEGKEVYKQAEYFFHCTLLRAGKVRAALREHSEDVSREVVQRSVGYFEGVLRVVVCQRRWLAGSVKDIGGLRGVVDELGKLAKGGFVESGQERERERGRKRTVRWLVQILRTGVTLVEVHARLGGVDDAGVRGKLQDWVGVFTALRDDLSDMEIETETRLDALREDLDEMVKERPDLGFVLRQIRLWTAVDVPVDGQAEDDKNTVESQGKEGRESDINALCTPVLTLASKLLVALQHFQAAAKTLPQTTDDPAWLVSYSDTLSRAVDALRIPRIVADTKELLQTFSRQANTETEKALLSLLHPLLSQYTHLAQNHLTHFTHLHLTTARLSHELSSTFLHIATHGFCGPQDQPTSSETNNNSGKLETGTGLGEGEGAEDISNDIAPDEDLSELAQDAANREQKEMDEDNKEAVDMQGEEMEGVLGDVNPDDDDDDDQENKEKDGKDGDKEEDGEEEMDEEAGEVDDLDPTAVDEKMWDGGDDDENKEEKEGEKEQQGGKEMGQREDEMNAAEQQQQGKQEEGEQQQGEEQQQKEDQKDEQKEEQKEGDEEEGDEAGEMPEGAAKEELNRQDMGVQEEEALALPEDLEMDLSGDEKGDEDELDELDDLGDMEDVKDVDVDLDKVESEQGDDEGDENDGDERKEEVGEEHQKDEEIDEDEAEQEEGIDAAGDREEEMDVDEQEDGQEAEGDIEDEKQKEKEGKSSDTTADADAGQANGGLQDKQDNHHTDNTDTTETDNAAGQQEQGAPAQPADDDNAPGAHGALSSLDQPQDTSQPQQEKDNQPADPFKKLGDALERWYQNQREIQAADANGERDKQSLDAKDMARAEFQHLQDENAEADTQALGTATNDEARPMDDAMAVDMEMEQEGGQVMPDDGDEEEEEDVEMQDVQEVQETEQTDSKKDDARSGVATRRGVDTDENDETDQNNKTTVPSDDIDSETADEAINTTSTQLHDTHLSSPPLRDYTESLTLWTTLQTKTQPLSHSLAAHLRLILTPTQATKLSGTFRTGKRLNIKKIIPYIASGYKRDKIWMRRAVPSKRAYQILLCVDDSASMAGALGEIDGETPAHLALESLVMVARALAVLEAGSIGVLGFGSGEPFLAHSLSDPPFTASADAGARVLQKFTFRQEGTDMVRLLRGVVERFREGRLMQSGSSGGEELWQLALVLSDGLVQSREHALLRPLLREALEMRVMVVFIVMDDAGPAKTKRTSVLDLKEARFGPDGVPVIHRYLDSFPFPYYLIVHHLADLPGALAGLLRSWFAEVNA